MERGGYVYLMSNQTNTTLYIGVTSNLVNRVYEHKNKTFSNSFTSKYNCNKLVYYECFTTIDEAIIREKNLKNWKRDWKNKLINEMNPNWVDLSLNNDFENFN